MTFAVRDERALFSGDVLFKGSVGRDDLPGGDGPTLLRSIAMLLDRFDDDTAVLSRPHGHHDARRRAREQPVPSRAVAAVSRKIQAPRGTYDVLPEAADARAALEATARRVLEGSGYRRIETPTFEHTELFSRGVGESTDIVQKEMYTFDDGGGRSVTLRPEGTAPICRAYAEHGMHKLPQPVKLWYLSSFFRKEKPQAGRYRQFWQVGAEALGSDDPAVDAETILLLATLLAELEVRGLRLRLGSLGTLAARTAYREELQAYLREHAGRAVRRGARAHRPQPAARVRLRATRGTQQVMAGAPRLLDRLDADDAEHFAAVRELLDRAGVAYEVDADARARDGLLHAHGLRVHLRRARRAERRRRRRALRRARRAARRPADAGLRLGGGDRADPARRAGAAGRGAARRPVRRVRRRRAARERVRRRRGGSNRAPERAARARRALAQGAAQAGRPAARPVRCDRPRRGNCAEGHAVGLRRSTSRQAGSSRGSCASGGCREGCRRAPTRTATRGAATCRPRAPARPRGCPAGCTAAATTAG